MSLVSVFGWGDGLVCGHFAYVGAGVVGVVFVIGGCSRFGLSCAFASACHVGRAYVA